MSENNEKFFFNLSIEEDLIELVHTFFIQLNENELN